MNRLISSAETYQVSMVALNAGLAGVIALAAAYCWRVLSNRFW
ncbi:MAG: hypothetical protein NVSMB17_05380 [Candidatus Dormibacteria bacterium]